MRSSKSQNSNYFRGGEMAGHTMDQNLIKAHETRMEGVEKWCEKLEDCIQRKVSSKSFWTGMSLAVALLCGILGVIWHQVEVNGKMMKKFQINQVRVLERLKIDPYNGE